MRSEDSGDVKIWKGAYVSELSQHSCQETEENHGKPVRWPRFKLDTPEIQAY